jgi:hypothetical protein
VSGAADMNAENCWADHLDRSDHSGDNTMTRPVTNLTNRPWPIGIGGGPMPKPLGW